ncbi:uncharacterized protein LOC135929990 [Gordionus sp. m RMFG-2023]|uniref:uncharacterized protein LOC135929990 n=1 Tax=Gordionus sp. m RMFG-2023 TaxID=3053472 RepID=UPI0031FBE4BD
MLSKSTKNMINSIWCLIIIINYNVMQGCEIKTFFNGTLEKREIENNDLFFISEHKAGSMNNDYITFENCNGTLNLFYERCDGYTFIDPLIVLFNTTDIGGGTTKKIYRLNNKGTNITIKGWRTANDQNVIILHWFNY